MLAPRQLGRESDTQQLDPAERRRPVTAKARSAPLRIAWERHAGPAGRALEICFTSKLIAKKKSHATGSAAQALRGRSLIISSRRKARRPWIAARSIARPHRHAIRTPAAPVPPANRAARRRCIEPARAETVAVGPDVCSSFYALGNVLPHAESEWAPLGSESRRLSRATRSLPSTRVISAQGSYTSSLARRRLAARVT